MSSQPVRAEAIFLKGERVHLRIPDRERHLPYFVQWFNDAEVARYLQSHFPWTWEREEEWMGKMAKSEHDLVFVIETLKELPIGGIGLHRISWPDGVAYSGTAIGNKDYWNQGYGTEAKMLLLKYAFHTLGLRKICSSVWEFNERSIRYNQKCGYKVEGRRTEQVFREGRYWDEILMAVWREDWESAWEQYQKERQISQATS